MRKHAFTIVELIIVIAVIGVLAAILIPTFVNVVDKANTKNALSDAKSALTCYAATVSDEGQKMRTDSLYFTIDKDDRVYYFCLEDGILVEEETSVVCESKVNAALYTYTGAEVFTRDSEGMDDFAASVTLKVAVPIG